MMCRGFRLMRHFGLALHFQPVLLELLRIQRLLAGLVLRRPALSAIRAIAPIRTITPVRTPSPSAAAATPPAAMLFAFLLGRTCSVLRALRSAWLLLLRRTGRALIRAAFALRTLCVLALGLGQFSLLGNGGLRRIGLRPVRAGLLLGRALVPARLLIATVVAIAARLMIALAVAAVALMIAPAVAASVTCATPTAIPAAALMAVTVLVARPVRPLRPGRTHRGFIGRERLLGLLFCFQPAEQAAEESRASRFGRLRRRRRRRC